MKRLTDDSRARQPQHLGAILRFLVNMSSLVAPVSFRKREVPQLHGLLSMLFRTRQQQHHASKK
jgi:hypothetical protein